MGDVVTAGLSAVEEVRANIRKRHVHTSVKKLENQLGCLKTHLDSLRQLMGVHDIVLPADVLKQLPFMIVGNFLETLEACDRVLCETDFRGAKLLKVVDRLALHNAKLKLLLPPKPDEIPTSQDQELAIHYLEAELQRSHRDAQALPGALPSAQYVKKAFKGTVLDGGTSTAAPQYFIDILNALVRHKDCLQKVETDLSADRKSISWVRLLVCMRLLLRIELWPAIRNDTEIAVALRKKHVSIQDFMMRLEFDLFCVLQTQRSRFPATWPSLETTTSLVQAYSWSLADQENDTSLEDEYILRARLVEPTNAVSFGLKRLPNMKMRIEFRDRINSQVFNLQQVVMVPTYVLGPDIGKPRMAISGKNGQAPVELYLWEASDLTTLQTTLTGYKPVYLGDQYEIEILPRARLGRLLSKSPRTYKGSIQLWQPNNLSAHHASNIRDVQEIGSHGARVQGVNRIEPRPSMLIFMEAAESQAQELTVFRIVLDSSECKLDSAQEQGQQDKKIKIAPASANAAYFKIETARRNQRDQVNLAIMGMFQQHRVEERERLDVKYVNVKRRNQTGVTEVKTMFSDLQMLHKQDMQEHWRLVNEDRAEANG